MNIQDRLLEASKKFNTKQIERDEHLKAAEECLEEMHRLQGEHRILSVLSERRKVSSGAIGSERSRAERNNQEANVIEAVPAGENK